MLVIIENMIFKKKQKDTISNYIFTAIDSLKTLRWDGYQAENYQLQDLSNSNIEKALSNVIDDVPLSFLKEGL